MAESIPKFSTSKVIRDRLAPVSTKTLRAWARQGLVRMAKLGDSKQAPALYRTEDIAAVLDAYADGRQPTRRRGR
jgi:hypothetical protein